MSTPLVKPRMSLRDRWQCWSGHHDVVFKVLVMPPNLNGMSWLNDPEDDLDPRPSAPWERTLKREKEPMPSVLLTLCQRCYKIL